LTEQFPASRPTLVLGVLKDKDVAEVCRILAPAAARILCVPVQNERTSDPAELARHCRAANPQARIEVCADLPTACRQAQDAELMVVTGSLFLVGEALAHSAGERERRLQ
jgi:dihydrofolate synthase/folylpolyglutamate synthase